MHTHTYSKALYRWFMAMKHPSGGFSMHEDGCVTSFSCISQSHEKKNAAPQIKSKAATDDDQTPHTT